jgi:hypothetical protein
MFIKNIIMQLNHFECVYSIQVHLIRQRHLVNEITATQTYTARDCIELHELLCDTHVWIDCITKYKVSEAEIFIVLNIN